MEGLRALGILSAAAESMIGFRTALEDQLENKKREKEDSKNRGKKLLPC